MTRKVKRLKRPGNVSLEEDARLAFAGADYQMSEVTKIFTAGIRTPDWGEQRFHWHLRSFFWELVALRDSLRSGTPCAQALAIVQALDAASWFDEVIEYRNRAHESFLIVDVLIRNDTNQVVAFELQPTNAGSAGDGLTLLKGYWENMRVLLTPHVIPPMPVRSGAIR